MIELTKGEMYEGIYFILMMISQILLLITQKLLLFAYTGLFAVGWFISIKINRDFNKLRYDIEVNKILLQKVTK